MGHDLDAAKAQRVMQSVELCQSQLGGLERHCAKADEAVRKAAGERLGSRRQAVEENVLFGGAHSGLLGTSMFNSRAALPPRIARRSLSSSPRAPSIKPIGSTSPMSAG